MTARLILTYPNPKLREVSKNVESLEFDQVTSWCQDIRDTMIANGGLGLAAPQVGLQKRIFAVDVSDLEHPRAFLQEPESGVMYFINPSIVPVGKELCKSTEACLSVPGVQYDIKRDFEITLSYVRKDQTTVSVDIKGKDAIVIQHEYDHLDGKLFIDRLNPFDKKDFLKRGIVPKRQKSEAEINHLREQKRAKARAKRKK
jgi:peptide deformylase